MGKISKTFALFLILIMAFSCLSLLMVKPASAQSTPIPSVPQFTVKFVNASSEIETPPTYTINPYTGQNVTTGATTSYVMNESIVAVIDNKPFSTYFVSSDGIKWAVNVYFDVRFKGHFGENWIDFGVDGYRIENPLTPTTTVVLYNNNPAPEQESILVLPPSGQIDVQAQEFIGYIYYGAVYSDGDLVGNQAYFNGTGSGWSNTQTVTIPESNVSALASPTTTSTSTTSLPSTLPELSWLVILPLLLSVFFVAVIFRLRKNR